MDHLRTLLACRLPGLVAIALFWVVTAGPAAAQHSTAVGRRVALVIGVSDYNHVPRLANPRNDAREVSSRLRRFGFDVETLAEPSPTKLDIDRALVRLRARVKDAEAVVVFFAGHGIELSGRNYLLPADARLADERDAVREAVALDDVLAEIASATTGRFNLVILDACRENPFLARLTVQGRTVSRGLGRPTGVFNDTVIAFSTAENQIARDSDGAGHSPYTRALLHVWDTEPSLEVGQFFRRVRARVLRATDNAQKPWEAGSQVSEFYFQPATGAAPAQSAIATDPDLKRQHEWRTWQALMKAEFDQVDATAQGPEWKQVAWGGFLRTWREDNPFSTQDESLRKLAQARLIAAQKALQPAVRPDPKAMKPGQTFQDCDHCPVMVLVGPGSFAMGSAPGETGHLPEETPVRTVMLAKALGVARLEVTWDLWLKCVDEGACAHRPSDPGWGRGSHPVVNVSWGDTQDFTRWLSAKTRQRYRLLSEAEWEYAARAGRTMAYAWGETIGGGQANCYGCGSRWDNRQAAPVGSFAANPWGLHDMHGNVWEWVQDCFARDAYKAGVAPLDGRAHEPPACGGTRTLRGGSWKDLPRSVRSASRMGILASFRGPTVGFRVAREVD